ncbi:MAG: phosphatase PAP2 family protein [Spirochaetaceae bacterium]|nr:phosphatase PAP2 family protein [Spirochaetaceae bacterium]
MNMEAIYDWGLSVISDIQQIKSPFMNFIMITFSFFGDIPFYLVVIAISFWCVSSKKGLQMGFAIIFSGALNNALKHALKVPRPFIRDSSVFIVEESGYSTPSGHSQGSASFYPVAANALISRKNKGQRVLVLCVAVLFPLVIGFSRIYLGVHYPTDVFLGLIIGFLTSTGILLFWENVAAFFSPLRTSIKLLILALVCFLLNSFSGKDTSMVGLLFGFVGGYIFLQKNGGLDSAKGSIIQKVLRLLTGGILLAFVYFVLKSLFGLMGFNDISSEFYSLFRFVRYGVTGAIASYFVPILFFKLNLAQPLEPKE